MAFGVNRHFEMPSNGKYNKLIVETVQGGQCYEFFHKRTSAKTGQSTFTCKRCRSGYGQVRGGHTISIQRTSGSPNARILLTDPEDGHANVCQPFQLPLSLANSELTKARMSCQNGDRSRVEYENAVNDITASYAQEQDALPNDPPFHENVVLHANHAIK